MVEPDWVWVGCGYQPECTYEEQFRYYPGAFIAQSAGNVNNSLTCSTGNPAFAGQRHYLPYSASSGVVQADQTDGIMVVGAFNKYGVRPSPNFSSSIPSGLANADPGSNFGDCVDIFAPGDEIYSTWGALTGNSVVGTTYSNVGSIGGTSMSAPHVAAAAASFADTYNVTWPGGIEQYIRLNSFTRNGQLVFVLP